MFNVSTNSHYVARGLGRLSCDGRNHSQAIFTTGILLKISTARSIIDFFCKNIAASIFCDDRKFYDVFTFGHPAAAVELKIEAYSLPLNLDVECGLTEDS